MWAACHSLANADLTVPEWSGCISQMSAVESASLSCIRYMTHGISTNYNHHMQSSQHSRTNYVTVRECLIRSLKVSAELKQRFTFVTMDLAAARIAYDVTFDCR